MVLLTMAALCPAITGSGADTLGNPYERIVRRNIFGLRSPAPAQKVEAPATPLPNILLTGITTILGEKRAFLEITPLTRPPQPPKPQSCILTEGQREGDVQVLQIDAKSESVRILNTGVEITLTFEKNGRKPTTVAAAAPPRQVMPSLPVRRLPFNFGGQR
jgi:hypothetical protein